MLVKRCYKFRIKNIKLSNNHDGWNLKIHRHYRRVVVTGVGLVSPLGIGVQTSWNNLIEGKSGVTRVQNEARFNDIPCKIAAHVPKIDDCLDERFTKNEQRTLSKATLFTLIATQEALDDAQWKIDDKNCDENKATRTGVAIGTGMVNFDDVIEASQKLQQQGWSRVSPHFITKVLLNLPAGYVSMRYGFRGPNHTVSTACTTGAHAIGDAFNLIKLNYADLMVCGGVETPINPLSFAAFCRIRALCTKFNDRPAQASRPFDQDRSGFVMGECAAVLLLEELEHAKQRKAKIYAEILGYGFSADAFHVTAPSEDGRGAKDSMLSALKSSNLSAKQIGHINCHATSTPLGDLIELKAIEKIFGNDQGKLAGITSTKSSTGHLLGATGAAEAIFTILACHHGTIPPTLNLEKKIETKINIVNEKFGQPWSNDSTNRRIALTNSFGFGGTNASLVFSNWNE